MLTRIIRSPVSGATGALASALLAGLSWAGLGFPDDPKSQLNWLAVWFGSFFLSVLWAFVAQAVKIHNLEARFESRASMKYCPEDPTVYVQTGEVVLALGAGRDIPCTEYTHHIGVVNRSAATLRRLRVVLEEVTPHADHYVYRGKPMAVHGERADDGYFDLPPTDGQSPARYVAFLRELIPKTRDLPGYHIPYAGSTAKLFQDRERRVMVFRLEGGDMTQSELIRTEVRFDHSKQRYIVTEI